LEHGPAGCEIAIAENGATAPGGSRSDMTSFKRHEHRTVGALPGALAVLLMLTGPGCASLTLLNFKGEKFQTADATHPPIEVLAIWQAAEGPGPGGIPTRGFAGQIFFFAQDQPAPVIVDGKTRIYIFDDHGTAQQQARPLHQFDFERDSWKAHLQTSKLGPTYGVFIPYPRNDYHQAICSLRIRFTSNTGAPLYSAASTIVLPGPPLKTETVQKSPLESLAKKLQQQSQTSRTWPTPVIDTEPKPFSNDPRIIATQYPIPGGAAPSTILPGQPERISPVIQAAATAPNAADGSMGSVENAVSPPVSRQQEALQPYPRIKLQSVDADLPLDADGIGAPGEIQPATDTGPPPSRRSHPLAD
jgi:hypothetical protein